MTVELNKTVFLPGETVEGSFQVPSDLPSRLREVELIIELSEEVSVEYTTRDSDGDTRRTWTTETVDIVKEHVKIPPNKPTGEHKASLTLPNQNLPGMVEYRGDDVKVKIIARAELKYDRKLGFDNHEFEYFEVVPLIPPSSPGNASYDGLSVSISDNVVYAGDRLEIKFDEKPSFDEGFRSVRVEIVTKISATANGRSASDEDTAVVLETLDDIPTDKVEIEIPKLDQTSCQGRQFSIQHYLKVVLDKRLRLDPNLEIPIVYINTPRSEIGHTAQSSSGTDEVIEPDFETEDEADYDNGYDDPVYSSKPLEKTCRNCGSGYTGNKCEHCGATY